MKPVKLATLQRKAQYRKPGYLEACLALSERVIINGQEYRRFTPDNWLTIRQEYKLQLGDALHAVAGPIGRAINWPCLKKDGTTDLKPDSPCAKLRTAANNLIK